MQTIMEASTSYDQVADHLKGIQAQEVTLEFGHFYVNAQKQEHTVLGSDEHALGIQIGNQLAQFLTERGLPVHTMLFIDDLHGVETEAHDAVIQQRENALQHVEDQGFFPDVVVSEADLTPAAAHLFGLLKLKGIIGEGSRSLPKHWGDATLVTQFEDGSIQPACSLIDAALYLKELGPDQSNAKITVLHEKYRSQQDQVKRILAAFGIVNPYVVVVYYSDTGTITGVDSWSN